VDEEIGGKFVELNITRTQKTKLLSPQASENTGELRYVYIVSTSKKKSIERILAYGYLVALR
jgi:hypothetical protein